MDRIYLTILFRIHPHQWDTFERYEALVLAQVPQYDGQVHLRFKSDPHHLDSTDPHEIHVLSFPNEQQFRAYLNDPVRASHHALAEQSVASVQVIRGELKGPVLGTE